MKSELTEMMEELHEMYGEAALAEEAVAGTFVYIHLDQLHPHPDNPRRELGDLTELSESIKAKGIMQTLTVVPREAGGCRPPMIFSSLGVFRVEVVQNFLQLYPKHFPSFRVGLMLQ